MPDNNKPVKSNCLPHKFQSDNNIAPFPVTDAPMSGAKSRASSNWLVRRFREGVELPVPGFLQCKNRVCDAIGNVGLDWADKHRSELFMFAFFVSFSTLLIIGSTAGAISSVPSIVKLYPFMTGTIQVANANFTSVMSFDYYAGLNSVVVDQCDSNSPSFACPSSSVALASVDCHNYIKGCDACALVSSQTIMPVIIALVTQLPQIMGDLQRSTVKGDFQCMKVIGVVTGIIGMVGNLLAMKAYRQACFDDLQPTSKNVSITQDHGAALICLIVVTALKVIDIAAHLMVRAPRAGESESEKAAAAAQAEIELEPLVEEVAPDRW